MYFSNTIESCRIHAEIDVSALATKSVCNGDVLMVSTTLSSTLGQWL